MKADIHSMSIHLFRMMSQSGNAEASVHTMQISIGNSEFHKIPKYMNME